MSLIKYGLYVLVIVVIAVVFEQVMTFMYDLTVQGIGGELLSYVTMGVLWMTLYVLAKAFLNKRIHPSTSQFLLWASMFHIGGSLAVFFYTTNPSLLLAFPIVIGVVVFLRRRTPYRPNLRWKSRPIHPLFVDDTEGICCSRTESGTFQLVKFFTLQPPFPLKELLLFLFHEQITCVFEVHHHLGHLEYSLGLLERARDFRTAQHALLTKKHLLRQFFKSTSVIFQDVKETINVLKCYYAPYFLYRPAPLDSHGCPMSFPSISSLDQEVILEHGFDEMSFTLSRIRPTGTPTTLYPFLEAIEESVHFQLYLHPLNAQQINQREALLNTQYKETLRRLTSGLESNSDFQAASYLFNQPGDSHRETIEPLLDQADLKVLNDLKEQLRQVKAGRLIGLWNIEAYVFASAAVAQTVTIKLNSTKQSLPPSSLTRLTGRTPSGDSHIIDGKELITIFPSPLDSQNPPNRTFEMVNRVNATA